MNTTGTSRKNPGRGERRPRGFFFTLGELAGAVGGRVIGDPRLRLAGIEPLDRAGPEQLSWVADSRHARAAAETRAGALLVPAEAMAGSRPAVVVENATLALAIWLERLYPPRRPRGGVSPRAHVHSTARIGAGASVAPGATIGAAARIGKRAVVGAGSHVGDEVEIGEDTWLAPNVTVLAGCRIGARCIIHSGAVIGSDGFGYVWDGQRHRKIPQVGIVRVEDDVEIGANTTIDRATLGETVIGRGARIDNLVQVAHNVVIGENAIVCAQVGIAGSSTIGPGAMLAGQVGISDHVTVGAGAILTGQAGVAIGGRVPAGAVLSGMPAAPHREFLRSAALVARLPELARRLERLERDCREDAGKRKGGEPWSSESPRS